MHPKELVAAVEASPAFAAFREESPDAAFVHLFSMHAPGEQMRPQLGYHSPATGKVTVFTLDPVERLPADEPFSKGAPAPLDLSGVRLTPEEGQRRALDALTERHPGERATRVILLLQHLASAVYNVTLITDTYAMVNVRIEAATGALLSLEKRSLLSLGSPL